MSAALFDAVARIARHEAGARMAAAVGTVTEVHLGDGSPPDHAVTVQVRETGQTLPRLPLVCAAPGASVPPLAGALVLVVFADGDPNGGVVVGSMYHPDNDPPKVGGDTLALHLPTGEPEPKLRLEIARSGEQVSLQLGEEVTLRLDGEGAEVTVGAMALRLTTAGGGEGELKAGGSRLRLKENGDVTLEARGKLTLEGAQIELAAQGNLDLSGAQVNIN